MEGGYIPAFLECGYSATGGVEEGSSADGRMKKRRLLLGAQEFDGIYLERGRELFQDIDRGRVFLPLQHADIVAVDLGTMRQLLLSQAVVQIP